MHVFNISLTFAIAIEIQKVRLLGYELIYDKLF